MLWTKPLTLEDKPIFDRYLSLTEKRASEMTFTNLFSWRNYYHFQYAIVHDVLCIIASETGKTKPFCLFPIGRYNRSSLQSALDVLSSCFRQSGHNLRLERVTDNQLEWLKRSCPGRYQAAPDRDNSDYLYQTHELIALSGRKFSGKRNLIHQFHRQYHFEYEELTNGNLDRAKKMLLDWYKAADKSEILAHELTANMELLEHYPTFGCKGALISVNGTAVALTVGELLDEQTAVIHLEKCDRSVRGLYQLLNQEFCRQEWANTSYVNREQDLGLSGLRKSKMSYHPKCFVDKYTISFH